MSGATVTMDHVRELGYSTRGDGRTFCASGVRQWCAANGIDYLQLVRSGVPADVMRATDSYGHQLANLAEGKPHGQQ